MKTLNQLTTERLSELTKRGPLQSLSLQVVKSLIVFAFFLLPLATATAETTKLIGEQRTPAITSVTSSGTVAAGAKSVDFIFSSDFAGTLLGVAYAAGSAQRLEAPPGDTLKAIAYTRSAGSIRIVVIR